MVSVESFIDLARKRDIGKLRFALRETNFDINSQDQDGRTALHHAIREHDVDIAQHLVDFGCDVNLKDETTHRDSPLHIALRLGHLEATKMLIEAPTFDIMRCDALQRGKMLPELSLLEDVYSRPQADSDSTMTKRKSFGDQFVLLVRQNLRELLENGNVFLGGETIRDMLIVQDDLLPTFGELAHRLDLKQLSALYVVDCELNLDEASTHLSSLPLHTLVLSRVRISRLPSSLFRIESLQILKVDNNHLTEIPAELAALRSLRTFSCDRQRPRLRSLPQSITQLEALEVLTFSNNAVENIAWIGTLSQLRVLRCDRNRISRLPAQMCNMRELGVLDISHNRIEYIPASLADLFKRLYFCRFYNRTLRPSILREERSQLVAHLELENYVAQSPGSRTARDISVAVVGESHSGKSTLVEALKADRGVCKQDMKQDSHFNIQQFEMHTNEDCCYVSTIVLANDVLDNFSRNIHVDLYLLVVDLTSLELQNGSQHLFARHVNRMQMWLEALYEVAPYTPVLLVGTHAEQVKAMGFADIWHILENFLDQGRSHHMRHYADSRISSCLLCNPRGTAIRHVLAKSRSGSAGFVDLSFPHGGGDGPLMNGHIPLLGESPPPGRLKFSHVLGYYEIDSKKNLPKDAKKNNVSIEQLKSAIIRMTLGSPDEGIPPNWLAFIRHLANVSEQPPNTPCMPFEEVTAVARSFDITPAQVPMLLQYFHNRGKLVFFSGDEILSKLVVISPTWFIRRVGKTLDGLEGSSCSFSELLSTLSDRDIDRQLQKAGVISIGSAHWLVAALQRLDVCAPFVELADGGDRLMLFPNLLEVGQVSTDVWPELPEPGEKQVTVEFSIRALRPAMFGELILRINREGRQLLELVHDPAPVFLAHHAVFFSALDVGGCDDCMVVRRHLRSKRYDDNYLDDVLHKIHVEFQTRMDAIRVTVRGTSPCCTMRAVLDFLALYLDDSPDAEESDAAVSLSFKSESGAPNDEETLESRVQLLCPKCVLLRVPKAERIARDAMTPKRKAICSKWHNLGSWTRALTGDYPVVHSLSSVGPSTLPDSDHPRLVLILPPSCPVSKKDWYMFCRMKFLEGFEVHFLCEYTGYWHLTNEPGFRLNQSKSFAKKVGNQLPVLLKLALSVVQMMNGCHEHGDNSRVLTPVVADLIKTYDYLRNVDTHIGDPHAWLSKNKDRVVNMLTKVLANANDGMPDLYFKVGNPLKADSVFQHPTTGNRYDIARFLRVEASSGRFGALRPLYVGKEVRWLCQAHYEELRASPGK